MQGSGSISVKLCNVLFLQTNVIFLQFCCTNDSDKLPATTLHMWPLYIKKLWTRACSKENTVPKEKKNERKLRHISKHCYLKRCKFRNSVHASSTRTSTLQMKVAHKIDVVPTYTAKPVPQKTLKHRLPRLVYYNITLILLPLLLALLTDFTQIPLKGKILLTEK